LIPGKYLRQKINSDFSIFNILIPALGCSLSPSSPQKDYYPTSCLNGTVIWVKFIVAGKRVAATFVDARILPENSRFPTFSD